ncbi:helix-turn-helix domain-containing protein [Methylobacterium aquaticum]|nr:helix-turn-helix domain-containing protein [Methylobacterium aquaticum]
MPATARAGGPDAEIAFDFDRVFTVRETAERLGISPRQVEMHIADGTLAAVDVGRGSARRDLRILDEDLDRFVEARKVAGAFGASLARAPRRSAQPPAAAPLAGTFIAQRRARASKRGA